MQTPFTATELFPGVFSIKNRGGDAYLLVGEDGAIMVDSGMNTENIRAFAQTLTDKPLTSVVNTHSHFDHTAGNGWFDVVYATAGIARSAKNTMGGAFSDYPLDYTFTLVQDGDVIGPRGRRLTVLQLDSHSPGNIALLDRAHRLLFPGDEVECGQVLLLPGYAERPGQLHARSAASVETYLRAMRKLESFRGDFDAILPAHNGAPISPEVLEKLIRLAEAVLAGLPGNPDCSSPSYNPSAGHFPLPTAHYRRAEQEGVSLVYCADLLWDRDYAKGQPQPATRLHEICASSIQKAEAL